MNQNQQGTRKVPFNAKDGTFSLRGWIKPVAWVRDVLFGLSSGKGEPKGLLDVETTIGSHPMVTPSEAVLLIKPLMGRFPIWIHYEQSINSVITTVAGRSRKYDIRRPLPSELRPLFTPLLEQVGVPKDKREIMLGRGPKPKPQPEVKAKVESAEPKPADKPSKLKQLLESDVGKTPIEELKLSKKTKNLLSKAGVETVGDAMARQAQKRDGLLSIDKFGDKSLKEFSEVIADLGLDLPEPVAS